MNQKEQDIFIKGIEMGIKMCRDFGQVEKMITKKERVKKSVVKDVSRKKWTDEEINILKDNENLSRTELYKLIPNHNTNSIGAMKYYLFGKSEKKEKNNEEYEGLAKLNQVLIS